MQQCRLKIQWDLKIVRCLSQVITRSPLFQVYLCAAFQVGSSLMKSVCMLQLCVLKANFEKLHDIPPTPSAGFLQILSSQIGKCIYMFQCQKKF